jgi:micrococcal nuclease
MVWRKRARRETARSGWWTWVGVALIVLAAIGYAWKRLHKGAPAGRCPPTESVAAVLDGDTVRFDCGGALMSGRLAGVDAPEKQQARGPEARAFLEALLAEGPVTVETVSSDRYGRAIVELRPKAGGATLNQRLVAGGFAWHYKRFSDDAGLAAAEEAAREARLGLWADADPTPPWAWRKARKEVDSDQSP